MKYSWNMCREGVWLQMDFLIIFLIFKFSKAFSHAYKRVWKIQNSQKLNELSPQLVEIRHLWHDLYTCPTLIRACSGSCRILISQPLYYDIELADRWTADFNSKGWQWRNREASNRFLRLRRNWIIVSSSNELIAKYTKNSLISVFAVYQTYLLTWMIYDLYNF